MLTFRLVVSISILTLVLPIMFWNRGSLASLAVSRPRPHRYATSQFIAAGDTQCLPPVTPDLIDESINKHASCRKFSPFTTSRARIATVTAHFGAVSEHYKKAFKTHLLHSLIHGTEVRVMCDPIIDDLWNKPAYILSLLMREMMKPSNQRLEWIMWVDRDTMILDQCRPISSFLPPERTQFGSWWRRNNVQVDVSKGSTENITEVNLLVTEDWNGLNNGIFLLRVNQWAVSLFTDILAFRHYKPDVDLPFTEQSAMEQVIRTEQFKHQTQFVPQYWFNAYDYGGPDMYARRDDTTISNLDPWVVRRGDYMVHFAGHSEKDKAIESYSEMLRDFPDVWEHGTIQRDIQGNLTHFWRSLGY